MTNNKQQTEMNKEFVPYELALELKQLGFDEPCLAFYDGKNAESFYFNNIRDASGDYIPFQKHDRLKWFGAPLYQQAFRWFREKHQLDSSISTSYVYLTVSYVKSPSKHYGGSIDSKGTYTNTGFYDTYEEAEIVCLKKLIEIVNGKQ